MFEYKVHYFGHTFFQSGLNEFGQQGWELVQFTTQEPKSPGEHIHYLCVFKRSYPVISSQWIAGEQKAAQVTTTTAFN
jgi:hypothetical protein